MSTPTGPVPGPTETPGRVIPVQTLAEEMRSSLLLFVMALGLTVGMACLLTLLTATVG